MPTKKPLTRNEKRKADGLCTLYVRIPPDLNQKLNQIVAKRLAAGLGRTRQEAIIEVLREHRI